MEIQNESLTKDQVLDVVQFAQSLWAAERYGMNFYSPDMSNALLKGLTNNPMVPTMDKLVKILSEYKANNYELQGYMEFMSHFDMIFERTLYSYVNALAFDLNLTCSNAFTQSDYESNEYLEDKNLEELADVMEVLFGLAHNLGYSEEDLLNKRQEKLKERGGFKDGIVLKKV